MIPPPFAARIAPRDCSDYRQTAIGYPPTAVGHLNHPPKVGLDLPDAGTFCAIGERPSVPRFRSVCRPAAQCLA